MENGVSKHSAHSSGLAHWIDLLWYSWSVPQLVQLAHSQLVDVHKNYWTIVFLSVFFTVLSHAEKYCKQQALSCLRCSLTVCTLHMKTVLGNNPLLCYFIAVFEMQLSFMCSWLADLADVANVRYRSLHSFLVWEYVIVLLMSWFLESCVQSPGLSF